MNWTLPPHSAFLPAIPSCGDVAEHKMAINRTMHDHGIKAVVARFVSGPSTVRYDIELDSGQKKSGLMAIIQEIALACGGVPISTQDSHGYVGLFVPRITSEEVRVSSLLDDLAHRKQALPVAIGISANGQKITADLSAMPHLLIAGATGTGKSVCLNALLTSLLARRTPDQVQIVMIDPKRVELTPYNGIPHLARPVITDAREAAAALQYAVELMERRYEKLAKGWKSIDEYNRAHRSKPWPRVLIVIDELADLMLVAKDQVETNMARLAGKARAAGIHLVVATQRPSSDIITGIIKSNLPSRIAFAVSSQVDSRTILDCKGAETLLGRGDALYSPLGISKPIRVQGSLVEGKEVERIVKWWSAQTMRAQEASTT